MVNVRDRPLRPSRGALPLALGAALLSSAALALAPPIAHAADGPPRVPLRPSPAHFDTTGCWQVMLPIGLTTLGVEATGASGDPTDVTSQDNLNGHGAVVVADMDVTGLDSVYVCVNQLGGVSLDSRTTGGGMASVGTGISINFDGSNVTPDVIAGGGGAAGYGPGGAMATLGGDAGAAGSSTLLARAGGDGSGAAPVTGGLGAYGDGAIGGLWGSSDPTSQGDSDLVWPTSGWSYVINGFGLGGSGAGSRTAPVFAAGGSGGGGWSGGGGGGGTFEENGSGAGGGGGSSLCDGRASGCSSSISSQYGVGGVVLTYVAPTTTTVAAPRGAVGVGDPVTYTATVSPQPDGGTVAFFVDGQLDANCNQVAVIDDTATCDTWADVDLGDHTISASFAPSVSGNFLGSSSTVDAILHVGAPDPQLSADHLDFGDVTVGTTATRDVTLTNNGTTDLVLLGGWEMAVTDPHAAGPPSTTTDFSVQSSDCSDTTLAPGESCSATIAFSPRADGAQVASLESRSNAETTTTASLTGTGVTLPQRDDGSHDTPRQDSTLTPDPTPSAPSQSDPTPNPSPSVRTARGAVVSPSSAGRMAVSKRGGLTLPLVCPGNDACSVDGTLKVATGQKARAAASPVKVLVRFSGIKVGAHKTRKLSLRLSTVFIEQEQKKGVRKLRTTVTLRTTFRNGRTATTRRQVTLLIPRARAAPKKRRGSEAREGEEGAALHWLSAAPSI
jgi:hypothetical protein